MNLGIRPEFTFLKYHFTDEDVSENFSKKYSNLSYNLSYIWKGDKDWNHSLSFNKLITRPNYKYINPFLNLNTDILYSAGNSLVNPTKIYGNNYELSKNNLFLICN